MNIPSNKAELGVDPNLEFQSCNMKVNQDFMLEGDGMHNSAMLLPELVNNGIRLLVYAGNAGSCNSSFLSPFLTSSNRIVNYFVDLKI